MSKKFIFNLMIALVLTSIFLFTKAPEVMRASEPEFYNVNEVMETNELLKIKDIFTLKDIKVAEDNFSVSSESVNILLDSNYLSTKNERIFSKKSYDLSSEELFQLVVNSLPIEMVDDYLDFYKGKTVIIEYDNGIITIYTKEDNVIN